MSEFHALDRTVCFFLSFFFLKKYIYIYIFIIIAFWRAGGQGPQWGSVVGSGGLAFFLLFISRGFEESSIFLILICS